MGGRPRRAATAVPRSASRGESPSRKEASLEYVVAILVVVVAATVAVQFLPVSSAEHDETVPR